MMCARSAAWFNGLFGVLIFSGSLPATRLALRGFEPLFLTYCRATIAGLAGVLALSLLRQTVPRKQELPGLLIVAAGVVIGFPLLTAVALQHITAARGLLYIALLPVMTAIFAVLRAGETPRRPFWFFSCTASILVMIYAFTTGVVAGSLSGDLAMFAAVVLCGLGYAEGGRLSRRLGGWQVISWSLLITLPVMFSLTLADWPADLSSIGSEAVAALLYVSLFSMLIGFIFWYRGLALGGVASIGQLQFLQPFFGISLAAVLLGEPAGWSLLAVMSMVIVCVAAARRFA